MKRLLIIALLLAASFAQAQLQSPEQFLGYKIGTHFTPHSRIVDYVRSVAAALPSTVKLQQYGATNEGRPLMALFVSSPQNIANLEAIRKANVDASENKNTNLSTVLVWLSYNVHGNEPSSSEAAMQTLYALADPTNAQTKAWLQNTVVVIDPCLNPDGRDRYVTWYNSVVGKSFDASPEGREHREPWPYGRTNHYNFDLNRDWAWQTQKESQERLYLYQQWLPQVHVDFHEQGINAPYYFAPAAEPFHEVITPWQREAQVLMGRNHAKYFDEKGWLYFTRQEFDLLYPSYGDTYPIYNGSIGMTYEQGGINGGLGVVTDAGDTLTLADRIQHHYTTGLSTVEVASKNASRLLAEFQNYYKAAAKGIGDYKAYIIKRTGGDEARIAALATLLQKNNIRIFSAKAASAQGYNYATGKTETFNIEGGDLVVPSAQPKSNLVKVLFEPAASLTDSATYDITAWSLPYVYALKAYATRTAVTTGDAFLPTKIINSTTNAAPYAYVIPWTGTPSAKAVSSLLQQGIHLRMTTTPFSSGGQAFGAGSVLVLKTGNAAFSNLWQAVRDAANDAGVKIFPVSSGFVDKGFDFGSSSVLPLKRRRVALFTDEGVSPNAAGEVWHFFEQQLNYPITLINVADAGRMNWNDYDVVIMPDGGYRFLSDKSSADALKTWINGGGHLIALEGGVAALSKTDWSLKAKKSDDSESKDPYDALHRYESRERDFVSGTTPGSIFKVELDNTHPLAFGYGPVYYTLKQDDRLYDFIKEDGWNVGVLKKDKQVSGFVGSKLAKRLQDGLLFGVQDVGRGSVTYFTDDVLFRNFWESGKLMFANAVFLVGQ